MRRSLLMFAVMLLAGCSGDIGFESDGAVDASTTAATGSEETTGSTSTPPVGDTAAPSTGRSERVQAAVLFNGSVWETDGGADLVEVRAVGAEAVGVDWFGADRNVVSFGSEKLELWHPDRGTFATADCVDCFRVRAGDSDIYALTTQEQLRVFDGNDLSLVREIAVDLPTADGRVLVARLVGVVGDELVVVIPDPAGISASGGGPEQVWMLDATTGAVRQVAGDDGNLAARAFDQHGSRLLVGGWGVQGPGGVEVCRLFGTVSIVDLDAGTTTDLGEIVPGDWSRGAGGAAILVDDVFWNGDVPYAVIRVLFDDGGGNNCNAEVPPALYRYSEADGWQLVDPGPLNGVRPIGPDDGNKVVVLGDGRGFLEADGQLNAIGLETRILSATRPIEEVNLEPPSQPAILPDVVIAPFNDLAGVELDSTGPIAALREVLGEPTADSGWTVGCPLDGDPTLDERVLSWGGLQAFVARASEDAPRTLIAWGYRASVPGTPDPASVLLPAGIEFGDAMDDVSAALDVPLQTDPVTEQPTLSIAGLTVLGDEASAVASVWVPSVLSCE